MERAIDHVRRYQEHIAPAPPQPAEIDGARLGLRVEPVGSAGLLVPGGRAAYPSTLIMLAVPAQVAGVERICMATPPPDSDRGAAERAIDDSVLAAAHLLGIGEVYCIGGSHAVAALACGTQTVPAVDFIAGPGSVYVQEAKRQLFGTVGVDGLYGPSEIAILADQSASAAWIVADVLAQLEHDPGAAFVVSADLGVLDRVRSALERQIRERGRQEAIERGLREFTAFVLAADGKEACAIMNRIAPEHAVLAVADPHAVLDRVHNAGAYFLGGAPVASGDYYAGPSHCLPTGSTARFSSGCSVYTFLRRASLEEYPNGMARRTIDDIAVLAEAEGLDAHAASVRMRGD
jgi:histidinol dehydrogenase